MVTQTRKQPIALPRPPHPDSLINKFAFQGFKSRRQREKEVEKIAEELKTANFKIMEVMSPLDHELTSSRSFHRRTFDTLISCADNPLQKGQITINCQGEKNEYRETSKWMEYSEFVNCFTLLKLVPMELYPTLIKEALQKLVKALTDKFLAYSKAA
jgi:hypothetical protein